MKKGPDEGVRIIHETEKYRGHLSLDEIELEHRLFAGGWGTPIKREVVRRANAVAVFPYDPVLDSVVTIRQFRIGAWDNNDDPWLRESVAGLIEDGEVAEDVARRETLEEAGCEPRALIKICEFYSSPGMLSEFVDIYCGIVDASHGGGYHGLKDEGEDIEAAIVLWRDFETELVSGGFRDCKLQLAGYWLLANRDKIRNEYGS